MEQKGSDDDRKKLEEIKDRWKDNLKSVCSDCMYTAIRHQDRNVGCQYEDEERNHPDRYDGELYAEAGADIKFLLEFIEKIKK